MKYSTQILFYTILPLIIVLIVVSFGSISLHQDSMREMIVQRDAQLAAAIAARLSDDLDDRVRMLQGWLAASPQANPTGLETMFDAGLASFDAAGRQDTVVVRLVPFDGLPAILSSASGQPGSAQVAMTSTPATAWLVVSAEDGRTAVGGVSAMQLHLIDLVHPMHSSARAEIFLTDSAGRVIYAPGQSGSTRPADAAHLVTSGAEFRKDPVSGEELVVAAAPVAVAAWRLVIQEPWVDASMPTLRYSLLAPLVVLVAAVGSLAAVYFGLRRVIRPLQILGDRAGRFAWGDFQALNEPVNGVSEIGDLQRALQEMAAQIHRYQAGMQDYIAALTQAQEEERRRLARELHDETVQGLIALSQRVRMIEFDMAACTAEGSSEALLQVQRRLAETSGMIDTSLAEVRRLIRDLRPIYLEELGLVPGLEMLVESASRPDLAVSLDVTGDERRMSDTVELAVYRIAQECLNNALRHAGATEIGVRVDYLSDGVTLTIEDNGAGFDAPEMPGDLASRGHFGLIGIHERATRLGGYLSIRSTPAHGTRMVAFLPAGATPRDSVAAFPLA